MNIIRELIERWVNKHGDGQLSPNHQSGDDDCNDTQDFHDEFSLNNTNS
jgi:hypothetical protein